MPKLKFPTDRRNRAVLLVGCGICHEQFVEDDKHGRPSRLMMTVVGLIDTGCSGLAVSRRVIEFLELEPTDTERRSTANGEVDVSLFDLNLRIRGPRRDLLRIPNVSRVACHDLPQALGIDVLIGREILAHFRRVDFDFARRGYHIHLSWKHWLTTRQWTWTSGFPRSLAGATGFSPKS